MDSVFTEQCLNLLKIDLGIVTEAYDERLAAVIAASIAAITDEGVGLDSSNALDSQLVVMYAAWLWGRRRTGEGMPRMLRFALNNRVIGERMKG